MVASWYLRHHLQLKFINVRMQLTEELIFQIHIQNQKLWKLQKSVIAMELLTQTVYSGLKSLKIIQNLLQVMEG